MDTKRARQIINREEICDFQATLKILFFSSKVGTSVNIFKWDNTKMYPFMSIYFSQSYLRQPSVSSVRCNTVL